MAASPGAQQHPHEVREALLGPDGRDHLGVGVELDVEAPAVEVGDRLTELGDAAAGRVAVVARVARRLGQLLDRDLGRRDIGVAEAQIDDVVARAAGRHLQAVDDREDVRRQRVDTAELERVGPAVLRSAAVLRFASVLAHERRLVPAVPCLSHHFDCVGGDADVERRADGPRDTERGERAEVPTKVVDGAVQQTGT